jgi:uncharacterized membrane protein YoaK (UPF0700 family)
MDQRHPAVFSSLLAGLAGIAGYVDAGGYLSLDGVFVANMTGNSLMLGIALLSGSGAKTLHAILALAGFLSGAGLGVLVTERSGRTTLWPRSVTAAIALEALLLVAVAALRTRPPLQHPDLDYLFVVALGVAMGLQSAAAQKLAVPAVSTVVLTSTLVALVTRVLLALRTVLLHRSLPVQGPRKGPGILLGVWGSYVGCGACGAAMARVFPEALFVPVAIAAVGISLAALLAGRGASSPG